MSMRRQAPFRGQLRNDYQSLLSQDWMSRHESLHVLKLTRFRAYWALLNRFSPDEAKGGLCTSRKADPHEVIVLKDRKVCKKKDVKIPVQKKDVKIPVQTKKICTKAKAKRSKQTKLCKAFGFRCGACRCRGH